jgi:2-polyprenyl-6-methoxyphenol hydroxylase-like FAD-dependent oxidoreductase
MVGPESIPVLIVVGGPIGLALAGYLGKRGIYVRLIDRGPNSLGPARMLEVGVRSMEFRRQLGIVDQVRDWGWPASHSLDSVFVTNLNGYELSRLKVPTIAVKADIGLSPERTVPCPQIWFDSILQRCAKRVPSVELKYKTELADFSQDHDGVTVIVRNMDTGQYRELRAQYLVGCDGADSTSAS